MANNSQHFKEILKDMNTIADYNSYISRGYEIPLFLKINEYDLEHHNYHILEYIYNHDKIIQKELSEIFYRNQSTITRSLKKLERKGFIERYHGKNKKNKYIKLTEKGTSAIEEIEEYKRDLENEFLENFTDEEKQTLKDLLSKLSSNIANNKMWNE